MNALVRRAAGEVAGALGALAKKVASPRPQQWTAVLNGGGAVLDVRIDDGWLVVASGPLVSPGCATAWNSLCWNGVLPGAAKFALAPEGRWPHLQAEVPLSDDIDLAAWLSDVAGALRAPVTAAGGKRRAGRPSSAASPAAPGDGAAAPPELARWCTEAGWTPIERADGVVTVALQSTRGAYQAHVGAAPGERVRIAVTLERCERIPPRSREAIAVLLLTLSGVVRLARAAVAESAAGPAVAWEVLTTAPPRPADFDDSFGALSIACSLSGAEVGALQNETVARQYLAARGWTVGETALSGQGGDDADGQCERTEVASDRCV